MADHHKLYSPLLKRTLINYQTQHLARHFDFTRESRILKLLITTINQAMEEAEALVGIKRVQPFELYLKKEHQEIILPFLKPEHLEPLFAGESFKECRKLIQQNCLAKMQLKLPQASEEDLLRVIDGWSLVRRGGRSRYQDNLALKMEHPDKEELAELKKFLDNLEAKSPFDRMKTPDLSAPEKLLTQLTEFVKEDAGLGQRVASRLVEEIITLRSAVCPRTTVLKSGEMPLLVTHVKAYLSEEVATEYRRLAPVIVSVITSKELAFAPLTVENYLKALKRRLVRVCFQAYRQNGLVTQQELQWIFQLSTARISELLRSFQREFNIIVPTPGTVLDAGKSMTHKDIIVRLYLEGLNVKEISQKTYHSPRAVDNYIGTFERVLLLSLFGLNKNLMARVLKKGPTLIAEYLKLVEEYYQDCQAIKEYLLARGVKL